MNEKLIALAVDRLPDIISGIKALFVRQNPGEPEPTTEEVMTAYQHAVARTLGVDEQWLRENPKEG